MKNVFIITTIKIYKGNSPGSARIMNVARALASRGVKVYLCSSALKYNIKGTNFQEISSNIFLVGEESRKPAGRLRGYLYTFGAFIIISWYLQRIINLAKDIEGSNAFYLYPTTEFSMDVSALLIVKISNRYKLFYDVNELRRAIVYNKALPQSLFKKVYKIGINIFCYAKYCLAEKLTKYYDGLLAISTNIEGYFKKYNKNIIIIPILSCFSEMPFPKMPTYLGKDKFLICFTGDISLKKEGFDILYKALSLVKDEFKGFELHLYGWISKDQEKLLLNILPLKYRIIENIIYHGLVEQSGIIQEMQKCNLLVLPRPLNLQTKYGFATKLSEYLVSGVPALVTDVSDNALYIKDGYNGFIVEPGDYKEMAEKILYIISNYNKIKDTISNNAYLTAKKYFDYRNYSEKIYGFMFEDNAAH